MKNFKIYNINIKSIYKILLLIAAISIFGFFFLHLALYLMNNRNNLDIRNTSSSLASSEIRLPIVMYHSILKSKSGDYIVHPDTLENDFKYIQNKGYSTITMSELINFVYNDTPLPEKPIIITFDDGNYNNLSYAVPLLHKYNMKAVISIVGSYTDTYTKSDEANPNYGYLRWKDISELMTDSCVEFQNHTYNLHSLKTGRKGCRKLSSESLETYTNVLTSDLTKLQNEFKENCNGYIPNTFTYPFGSISKESEQIIKDLGFKASLSCTSGVNTITKDPNCLYLLRRNNRVFGISSEQFFSKILE